MTAPSEHPLATALRHAADGRFPPVDGVVEVVPPDAAGTWASVEFTGHSFVLTDRDPDDPLFEGIDAFGGATQPRVLLALAGDVRSIGSLDLVMVRRAGPAVGDELPETDRYDDHPRVLRAGHHRRDVRVFGDERGLACVGSGLVGRTEVSVEVHEAGLGAGRSLLAAALAALPSDELVFAQVAPGNAVSVRMFVAGGFVPIGSEVLLTPPSTA